MPQDSTAHVRLGVNTFACIACEHRWQQEIDDAYPPYSHLVCPECIHAAPTPGPYLPDADHEWVVGMLKAAAAVPPSDCPGSTAGGCRCSVHHPSVRGEVRLHVATLPQSFVRCDGTMTCPCESCDRDRQHSAQLQRKAAGTQPWQPRRIAA